MSSASPVYHYAHAVVGFFPSSDHYLIACVLLHYCADIMRDDLLMIIANHYVLITSSIAKTTD